MNQPANQIHHAASTGFAAQADSYARGRPDYPDAIVGWMHDRLGLSAETTALDLGAGTGKFTAYLLRSGTKVIALEPVQQMREKLLQALPGVEARDGTAEAIPLPDASVDAVVCAQSFHWFATKPALAEIHRVLKPGGTLGLVWNMRDEGVAWVAALTDIMKPYEGDTPRFAKGTWKTVFPFDGFGALREQHFDHGHSGAPEDVIVNRIRSISFIAELDADRQAGVVAQLHALIASKPELAGKDVVTMPYTTAAFSATKTASLQSNPS
jgi:SAM-dependent methyltransferase